MIDISSFEEHLQIDKFKLDDEIVDQSDWYHVISDAAAEAASIKDYAKKNLDETYASIYTRLRRMSEKTGTKLSEERLKQSVVIDSNYITAQELLLEAKRESDRLNALKDAFYQRGYRFPAHRRYGTR